MLTEKKQRILFLALNVFALTYYFVIILQLLPISSIPEFQYSTSDSMEYRGCFFWLNGGTEYYNSSRTLFYPLLIFISTFLGTFGLWILQLIMWLTACNLVFLILKRVTGKVSLACLGFLLCSTNISLIALTLHALTEITVFFLLTLTTFIYFPGTPGRKKNHLAALFLLSLLAATKPVYQFIWYVPVLLFLFYQFKELLKIKTLLLFVLCLSPVIIQKSIDLYYQDATHPSLMVNDLKKYLYRKVLYFTTNDTLDNFGPLPDSIHQKQQEECMKVSTGDAISFLLHHPVKTTQVFFRNIENNVGAVFPYIDREKNKSLSKWTENINDKLIYVHALYFLIWSLFLLIKFKTRGTFNYQFIFLTGFALYYIFFTSGLVFWAGDRLIAPAASLWICMYITLTCFLFRKKNARLTN